MRRAEPDDPPSGRWEEIERLFRAAIDLSPEARGSLVAGVRDPGLRRELLALLAAHAALCEGGSNGFLETPAAEMAGLLTLDDGADAAGALPPSGRIGPYRIVEELGRGGMGVVYLAERSDGQFEQRVALKLVPRGIALDARALHRFRSERQILASLEHPGIARLLDGGVSADGLPWFAMEHVEGTPIDRFCDAERLSAERRLRLFSAVCDAVGYAHRCLVVHRDLKPSNILVDRDGTPKLLDFGIARLLASGSADAALTRTGAAPMTPGYASPEQIRGEPVSTASDVYSLGVLLYELLTGRPPHRHPADTLRRAERRVLEDEPEPPSAACAPGTAKLAERAQARGTTPSRLSRRLRGDLDTIVLTALRKDPRRRYTSVEQLAGDVRSHLAGLPVSARPDTRAYRTGKFVRRHRLGVAGAAAFLFLLLASSILTTLQSVRIRAQAERTAHERDRAERVSGFLRDLFRSSDPYRGGGSGVTVREVLDSGAVRIDRELAEQPELRADLAEVMADAYYSLGLFDESRRLAESSLATRRRLHGEEHPAVAGSMLALAQALVEQGDYARAEALYRRSLAARRAHRGSGHPLVARSLNALARALRLQGRHAEAEPLLREALAIDRRHAGAGHADPAQSLRNLAHVLRDRGDAAGAEPLYREAHALHRARYGDEHPETANSKVNLAIVLHARGEHAAAESLFRAGLATKERLLGDDHADVAMDRASFAALLHETGRTAAAEDLYRRALAVQRRVLPADHPRTAAARAGLARVLGARGDGPGAGPLPPAGPPREAP